MPRFFGRSASNNRQLVKLVESVLGDLGASAEEAEIPTSASPMWGLLKGSAEVYIALVEGEDQSYVQVLAPVLVAPAADGEALLRRLLELNAEALCGAAFALRGNRVILCAERPGNALDREALRDLIVRVGTYADVYDDLLVTEFGGQRHGDA